MTYVHPIVVDAVYTHSIYSTANYRVSIIIANGMRQHSHSIPSIRLTITLYGRHIPSHELSSPSHSLSPSACASLLPYPCQWWIVNVACSKARHKCQCRLRRGRCRAASIAHDMFIGHGAVIQPKWFRFRPCRPFCHMNECSPHTHTHTDRLVLLPGRAFCDY